jgi:hypothetical protein
MRKTRTQLAKFAAIAMLSAAAVALSASTVGAAVDFSTGELSTIDTAMANAIASAKAGLPAGATGEQVEQAVAAAISNETQSLITQFGQMSPMLVAEAAVTAATDAGASPRAIGNGMAAAALAENGTVGLEIADAVGATAPRGAIRAFDDAANAAGTPLGQTLASAASSYENVGAGGRGGNGNGGNGNTQSFFGGTGGNGGTGGSGGGGGGDGCRNPSCN